MTRQLLRVDAGDPGAVFAALRAALGEHGPAVLPLDGSAIAAQDAGAAAIRDAGASASASRAPSPGPSAGHSPALEPPAMVAHNVALVIETSGSTGHPKRVALSADALLASAAASATALGGEGQWLLALPAHYIAGAQVLVRSICARTEPVLMPAGHFDPSEFARAALTMNADRRYVSLVPVQLARLLDAASDPLISAALTRFDRVLVGGQAMPPALLARAKAAGVRVRRSYGSSETAGGCVYDGLPIGSTRARVVGGLLELSGPSLAEGYLDDEARTAEAFHVDGGTRWYRTGDLGEVSEAGVVRVLGRADNVIISGGEKVSLDAIERVVHALAAGAAARTELAEALVVAAPSAEWGQVPVLVLAGPAHEHDAELLAVVRGAAASALGAAARPASLLRVPAIPRLPSGKPDRAALTARV